jgi:hypothetical protein
LVWQDDDNILPVSQEAIQHLEPALAEARDSGDRHNEAMRAWSLGLCSEALSDLPPAAEPDLEIRIKYLS